MKTKLVIRAYILLMLLVVTSSCENSIKNELFSSIENEKVEEFYYSSEENNEQIVASLTNKTVMKPINFEKNTANLILKYTLVKEKKSNTKKVYKTEIIKKNKDLELLVTDLSSNKLVSKTKLSKPQPHNSHDDTNTSESIDDCISDFYNSETACILQSRANQTCENQFAALFCCLDNNDCYWVHLIIKPTTWKCKFGVAFIPNIAVYVTNE